MQVSKGELPDAVGLLEIVWPVRIAALGPVITLSTRCSAEMHAIRAWRGIESMLVFARSPLRR